MNAQTILIAIGGLLVVAGILGGGLSLKEFKIPPLNRNTRVISFLCGVAFLVGAFYPGLGKAKPPQEGGQSGLAEDQRQKQEQERLAREKLQREEQDRQAQAERQRQEQERLARERLQREEQDRQAQEERQKREQARREEAARRLQEEKRPAEQTP